MTPATSTNESSNYAVWKTKGSVVYYVPYTYPHTFLPEQYWNPHIVHGYFFNYWYTSIFIVAIYVLGIHLLQRFMRDRKPFVLRQSLIIWNTLLAIFSTFGALRFGEEWYHVVTTRSFQDSVCLSVNPSGVAAYWATCFVLSKVAELVDTVFIVLRKKPLLFLHWYHHAIVLLYVWHAAIGLTAAGRWFMTMNYAVHSIMYTYYALASAGIRLPRWIAMGVTTLQTSQMIAGVFISLYIARLKWTKDGNNPDFVCQQSNENLLFCLAIYASFAVLFMRFFARAYLTKSRRSHAEASKKVE
jgi:elongation of very long chain fatty acids protein 6